MTCHHTRLRQHRVRDKPSLAKAAIRLYLGDMTTFVLMDDRARLRERFHGAALSLRARLFWRPAA